MSATRRGMLGSAAALLTGAATATPVISAPAAPHPDAPLLVAVVEHARIERLHAETGDAEMSNEDLDALLEQLNVIMTHRVTTVEGHRARARLMRSIDSRDLEEIALDECEDPWDRVMAALVRDLTAGKGATA